MTALALLVSSLGPSVALAHDDDPATDAAMAGEALVAGDLPSSTAFDPAEPSDGLAAMAGRLAAVADCGEESLALVQDNVPWVAGNTTIDPDGLGANAIELDAQGQEFCLLSSAELGTAPLAQFERIVLSGAQNQGFYDNLFPVGDGGVREVHPALDTWVRDGGTLIANLTDNASGPGNGGNWTGRTFVGGLTYTPSYQQDNDIVDASHPVVSGDLPCLSLNCGPVVDLEFFQRLDLDDWGYASHGSFQEPPSSTVLLEDPLGPVLVEYPHGDGSVLASMITTEFRYLGGFGSYLDNRELLANILSYQYTPDCTDDRDCDGIADDVEADVGTDPTKSDTDGDGLVDPWEVDPSVPGAGFKSSYPDGVDLGITQEEVFGPYGDVCVFPDENLRVVDQLGCFNQPPDPLHVDVYLELDWQDCQVDDCPEILTGKVDPIHHAPNLPGVGYAVNTFARAPVDNPDGTDGVNLNILIDERIAHSVNCDTDLSQQRSDYFGTPEQRADDDWEAIDDVRRDAVRYVWSGHSSFREGDCPNPNVIAFGATGFGLRNMEAYDFSPFGDVNVAGRDILLTLGPLWSCPATVAVRGRNPGPCYNATEIEGGGIFGGHPTPIFRPGIFPSQIDTPDGEIDVPYPISRLLGLTEQQATVQLWERTLTHLLGHSLGVSSEAVVGNRVDVVGAGVPGDRTVRSSTVFPTDWSRLQFAPGGLGLDTLREDDPDYVALAEGDADGDGTPEGEDNCPGLPNPDQDNSDIDEFGDACDGDTDGDGMVEGDDEGFASPAGAAAGAALVDVAPAEADEALDPYPDDTDNDGIPNDTDDDDDDDGVPDHTDVCPTIVDPTQVDTDGDGTGDACDPDDDDDQYVDAAEEWGGSDPVDPTSTWELLGWNDTCTDGVDNDRDGSLDVDDLGCTDRDGDTNPDLVDNCPDVATDAWYDADEDGIGDACDESPRGEGPGTLWIADGQNLLMVDPDTGDAEVVDDGPESAVVVAVDPDLDRVWTYGGGVLRALDGSGSEVVRTTLPVTSTNEQKVRLAVGLGGDAWVSVKDRLVHVGPDGAVLATASFADDITGLALDPVTERAWVGQKRSLVQVDDALATVREVPLDGKVADVALGPAGVPWVALDDRVVVLGAGGDVVVDVPVGAAADRVVVIGGLGWAAAGDDVVVIDPRVGEVARLVDVDPTRSGPKVVDVVAGEDGTAWLADSETFRSVAPDGALGDPQSLVTAASGATVHDLAYLPGGDEPADSDRLGVLVLSPSDGGVVGATEVDVSGIVSAPSVVEVAGEPAIVDDDGSFRAVVDLAADGRHVLEVVATSDDGQAARASVTVYRDTQAPDLPQVDAISRVSVNDVRVTGRAEPGTSVVVRNATVTETEFVATTMAADDGGFVVTLPAAPGHVLEVVATDDAGNASAPVEVSVP